MRADLDLPESVSNSNGVNFNRQANYGGRR